MRHVQGYVPTNRDRRAETLDRKREEYYSLVKQSFVGAVRDEYEDSTFRQVRFDVLTMR